VNFFSPEVLAIITGLGFAVSDVLIGEGVRTSTPYTGAVILSLTVGSIYVVLIPWVVSSLALHPLGLFWFLMVGVSQFGLGMFFFYFSMRRVGIARAAVISSSAPAFTVALAIAFMSEQPTLLVCGGTMIIITGVMVSSGNRGSFLGGQMQKRGMVLVFPLLTAFLFGISPIFRKAGLELIPSIPIGSALAGIGGFLTLLILSPFFPKAERIRLERRSFWMFLAGGLVMAGAQGTFFLALRSGAVTTVVPLVFLKPVFITTIMMLRNWRKEKLGLGVLAGSVLMVFGAWLILGF
jgi:drug/metabolite transporter (DMT)-like permease